VARERTTPEGIKVIFGKSSTATTSQARRFLTDLRAASTIAKNGTVHTKRVWWANSEQKRHSHFHELWHCERVLRCPTQIRIFAAAIITATCRRRSSGGSSVDLQSTGLQQLETPTTGGSSGW
jgi:hypothetical protein